ncbi:helix-turn-helix domain-containing protein [Rathayibacter tritici]|uniref:helix-turn-helix domain-containing protein n=1 Tax=Rathayibacter tritici TaxID=33888 RepID=UPI00358DE947
MRPNHGNAGSGIADPALAEQVGEGRYLSLRERLMIEVRRQDGWSFARIGAAIGRDRSIVRREVRRASRTVGVLRAALARHHAHQLGRRSKIPKHASTPELAWFVTEAMDADSSPKLIRRLLTDLFPKDGGKRRFPSAGSCALNRPQVLACSSLSHTVDGKVRIAPVPSGGAALKGMTNAHVDWKTSS